MPTKVDEIAPRIYRLSTLVPIIGELHNSSFSGDCEASLRASASLYAGRISAA